MKVSVIISTFNCERYISRTIRSCIEQSMERKDFEIIVVNDGSTDNTNHILKSFGDWIRVITLESNMGLPYASNMGIKSALGRFVTRVDADDYIHEDLLRVGYLYLSMNNNMDAVSFDYLLVDDDEDVIERRSAESDPIACGVIFRKDRLIEIGLYDEKLLLSEDEDLRIRFRKRFTIHNVSLPLYRYRMHENNSTKNIRRVVHYKEILHKKHKLISSEGKGKKS
ncbi:MAG TPA: glycosyltransferase family A protein [Candidatus Hodarchaeales archaeon]|nr:glycosyltransferase family A protein [Candidatus Hodarchaeales archaeon]